MDPSSMFATGGASGAIGLVLYLVYRFLFSKHRITSKCCGREMSIDVEGSTPQINNIKSLVEDAIRSKTSGDEGRCSREGQGQPGADEGRDERRVSDGTERREDEPDAEKKGSEDAQSGVQEGKGDTPSTRSGSGEL